MTSWHVIQVDPRKNRNKPPFKALENCEPTLMCHLCLCEIVVYLYYLLKAEMSIGECGITFAQTSKKYLGMLVLPLGDFQ